MKKKLLNFIIRLIRFFKKEDTLMPELSSVDENQVKLGHLYTHYGRVVVAHPNPEQAYFRYYVDDKPVTQLAYEEALIKGLPTRIERHNAPCHLCHFQQYGLPCRCDFNVGSHQGYWRIVQCSRQYADNQQV